MVKIGIIMGSKSDYKIMEEGVELLKEFNIPFECKIVSAHRTPEYMFTYAKEARSRGLEIIIAGAGGAAHLPGMVASLTSLPVIGIPIETGVMRGLDSLLSIVQMPRGVPVATMAINGSKNGALLALKILALRSSELELKLESYYDEIRSNVIKEGEL